MVGLGKLGLPVSYALSSRGIEVFGHDPHVWGPPEDCSHEEGLAELVVGDTMGSTDAWFVHFCNLVDAVNNTDGVVFLATQTPHEPRFEGVTPLPEDRADFDYSFLVKAVKQIVSAADALEKDITLAVISTVLPGTLEREVMPYISERVSLVYNPSFIAMGTTVKDFLDPEFVLLGGDAEAGDEVWGFYRYIFDWMPRSVRTSIRNAELIKVAYNTFIGLKIAFANTLMEVAHKTGCDVDEVTGALKLAHRRLISPAYMDGGMGDGGGCHPRDNIALSWLARELDLSHDLFRDVMQAREDQTDWLQMLISEYVASHDLPVGILGIAYKPESHITTGSAALLLKNQLEWAGYHVDVVDFCVQGADNARALGEPHVWLVGCKHAEWTGVSLAEGSIVIDPFRYIPDQQGVTVVRLGEAAGRRRGVHPPQVGAGANGSRAA